jgi:hypothetical protein
MIEYTSHEIVKKTIIFYDDKIWSLVDKYSNENWDWKRLGDLDYIDWSVFQKTINKNWNFAKISKRIDLDWKIVENNKNMKFDWNRLSINKSLTKDFIISHWNYNWNWNILNKRFNKSIQAIKIQRCWRSYLFKRNLYYNPSSIICQNRLMREFNELLFTFS